MLAVARRKLARHWGQRVLSRFVRDDPPSDVALTVLMPLAPKDAARAAVSVPAIRARLAHPVTRFLIVAPEDAGLRALAHRLDAEFLDECVPLRAHLGAASDHLDGWARQQFLKLLAPEIAAEDTAEDVLVIDADTYPLRPTRFLDESGRLILYRGDRTAIPYTATTQALIGPAPGRHLSFIAHTALMRAHHLKRLRQCIEARHAKPWTQAVLDVHAHHGVALSEFDLYGHFLLREAPEAIRLRYYANIKAPPDEFLGHSPLPAWKRRFRFVSNHERPPRPQHRAPEA
ncbi:MAG: DUF6492 family protein [Pseudomonadota bacterium]